MNDMKGQIQYYEDKLAYEMDPADLFERLGDGENLIVVDARREYAFLEEHIPGAVNIPHRSMNEASTTSLDRAVTYVCYCDGIGCNASTKAALKLARLGFSVRELIGGLEWWKKDGFATAGSGAAAGAEVKCAC